MNPYDPTFETYRNAATLSQAARHAEALHLAVMTFLLIGSMLFITLLYYRRIRERREMNQRLTRQAQSHKSERAMLEARAVAAERALSQTRAQLSQYQPSQPRPRPSNQAVQRTAPAQPVTRTHHLCPKTPQQCRVANGWMTAQNKARFN